MISMVTDHMPVESLLIKRCWRVSQSDLAEMLPIVFCNVFWLFEIVHLCFFGANWRWVHIICWSRVLVHIEHALYRSHSDLGKLPS